MPVSALWIEDELWRIARWNKINPLFMPSCTSRGVLALQTYLWYTREGKFTVSPKDEERLRSQFSGPHIDILNRYLGTRANNMEISNPVLTFLLLSFFLRKPILFEETVPTRIFSTGSGVIYPSINLGGLGNIYALTPTDFIASPVKYSLRNYLSTEFVASH